MRTLPRSGLVVANAREESLKRVLDRGCWSPVEWFGSASGWSVAGDDEDGSLVVSRDGKAVASTTWGLTGEHNRLNALAAVLAARHVGVKPEDGVAALARFESVKRRMEV